MKLAESVTAGFVVAPILAEPPWMDTPKGPIVALNDSAVPFTRTLMATPVLSSTKGAGWAGSVRSTPAETVSVASAEYDYVDPNQRVIPNRDQFDGSWRVGISANWNLYRGGADDLTARRADLLARQSRLREVAAADAAKQDLARRDLDLARIRAQVGTALRLEAIDRASALAQAESDVAQAVATENVAALQLSIARGEDPSLSIARGEDPSWK